MLDAEATMAAFANRGNAVVMDNPQVTAPVEVTLDDIARQRAVDREANLPTAEGYAKAEVPDLKSIVLSRVELMGPAAASVYFKRPVKVVKRWLEGAEDPGIKDLMLTLERPASTEDRQAAKAIELLGKIDLPNGDIALTQAQPRTPVQLCLCLRGDIAAPVVASWISMALSHAPFFRFRFDTMLVRSRNLMAADFIASGLPHSLWLDSDILAPVGSSFFQSVVGSRKLGMEALQANVIDKLLAHNRPMVGGVYAGRAPGAPMVIQPDLEPSTPEDVQVANEIREGQASGLKKVKWVASGCMLVAREVFLAVQEKFQDAFEVHPGEPFPFFNPLPNETFIGEDIAFSRRVAACGIEMFVDPTCVLGHMGRTFYMPEGTLPARRLS